MTSFAAITVAFFRIHSASCFVLCRSRRIERTWRAETLTIVFGDMCSDKQKIWVFYLIQIKIDILGGLKKISSCTNLI